MFRMDFSNTRRRWIGVCLKSASVSVLVNGSPTNEFRMSKGLRQGDPMAPFLFLIVAEGLNGLIRSVVDKNIYKEYILEGRDNSVGISHIQYADDTILMGEMSNSNVRALKCILRNFELASGLQVNFHKSGLMGVKVRQWNLRNTPFS